VALTPLNDEVIVMRVVPNFMPYYDAGKDRPQAKVFELSTEDKKQKPPRLSVFDLARTTSEEAKAICDRPEGKVFAADVGSIKGVNRDRIGVVDDPLPANHTKVKCPGAGGHCGITGLLRPPSEDSTITRNIRRQLADMFRKIE
jgi:hypothetical protein